MAMIKGITVTLMDKIECGRDGFNRPVYMETPVEVENVLVYPASGGGAPGQLNLSGKKQAYTLALPKDDRHIWTDRKVCFFGAVWKTVGFPEEGVAENIPLDWNRKVTVERYG